MIENHDEIIEQSRHNLMVRHVCPVGNITRLETTTPHGWAQLIDLVHLGVKSWNDETVDVLYQCADCGNCRENSVYDVALPAAIAHERAHVAKQDLALPAVYETAELLREWENPYKQEAPKDVEGEGSDALFVGDEAQHLRPQALEAALKLLKAVGVEPVLIGQGRNSGHLASSLGLPGVAKNLAQANLDELKGTGAGRLFVLSPGDFFAFNQMNEERLGLGFPEDVELLEVVPFLAGQLESGDLSLSQADGETDFAYLDPTQSVRVQERYDAPRRLLEAVLPEAPREVFWRNGRAYPTGNLALQFTHPDLADRLTQARLKDAEKKGAKGVITEGPGDLAHLNRHASASGMQVQGLYELLADHLNA